MTSSSNRNAFIVGLGLIGASAALALREAGWIVSGTDRDESVTERALELGVVTSSTLDESHRLVVVATPAGDVAKVVNELLEKHDRTDLIVTDVAGVKGSIAARVFDPRFVGGHPMAGSELRGMAGARADLFQGCTWVLTPTASTEPATYSELHGVLRELGANVVAVSASDHDRLVAIASHVPHLLAGALMNEASRVAEYDAVLLRLAAGGFRDMTRVAAGDPTIWPDVLFENRAAVTQSLLAIEARLAALRGALENSHQDLVAEELTRAAKARRELPGRALDSDNLAYLRVNVSDQPGVLASVTTAASEVSVNIFDIEIAHGIEGTGGTLLLAVDARHVELFCRTLTERGYQVGVE